MTTRTRHDPPWRFDQGGTLITTTDTITGLYRGLQALTTCTLDVGTVSTTLAGTLAGVTIPAGTTLHGTFTSIQLSAGTACAYR